MHGHSSVWLTPDLSGLLALSCTLGQAGQDSSECFLHLSALLSPATVSVCDSDTQQEVSLSTEGRAASRAAEISTASTSPETLFQVHALSQVWLWPVVLHSLH